MRDFISMFMERKKKARQVIKDEGQSLAVGNDALMVAVQHLQESIEKISIEGGSGEVEIYPEINVEPSFDITASIDDASIDNHVEVSLDLDVLRDSIEYHAGVTERSSREIVAELGSMRLSLMKLVDIMYQSNGAWLDDFDGCSQCGKTPSKEPKTNGSVDDFVVMKEVGLEKEVQQLRQELSEIESGDE